MTTSTSTASLLALELFWISDTIRTARQLWHKSSLCGAELT